MRLPTLLVATLIAASAAAPARAQDTVSICHATGDPQSPYQPLTLDNAGVLEHIDHEDDLVPAPADGCPATPLVLPEDSPVPEATPEYAVPTVAPTPPATPTATPETDVRSGDREDPPLVAAPRQPGPAPRPAAAGRRARGQARQLPVTGAEMWLSAATGLAFLLCGLGVRLLSPAAGRPPGPSGR